ncbi:MAG: LPS export ABC transporter periplasmic protein LptC [Wenzhouxiangellaceae bacterium]|nr:LPS export ABC transporter periplasmic protein LptC [Wenzhouxiangellaceae bacterium]
MAELIPLKQRHYWAIAIATLVLLLARNWWLGESASPPDSPESLPDRRTDYVLSDFDAQFLDANGRLEFSVRGPLLEHDAVTRQARITRPEFAIDPNGEKWSGNADWALLKRASDQLQLFGSAVIEKPHPRGLILIRSEQLDYDRNTATLHSPETAHMQQAGSELTGGTLTVWINDERMELEDHVHAIYRAADAVANPVAGQPLD